MANWEKLKSRGKVEDRRKSMYPAKRKLKRMLKKSVLGKAKKKSSW